MKRWQSLLLGVVVSIATLAYALNGVDLNALRGEFARARYVFFLPAAASLVLGLVLRGARWRTLLGNRVTLIHSFHILNVGYLFGTLLPFRLGEVARIYLVARLDPPVSVFTTLSTIVVERLTDILAIVIMVALLVSSSPLAPPSVVGAARLMGVVAIGGLVGLAILAVRRAWAHALMNFAVRHVPLLERFHAPVLMDRLLDGIAPLGSVRGLTLTLFWTTTAWIASVIAIYTLMAAFYDTPSLNVVLLIMALGALAVALPAVPGNVGPFEAAIVSGLLLSGMITPDTSELRARALAFAVAIHIVTSGIYAITGWIGLLHERVTFGQLIGAAQRLAAQGLATRKPDTDASLTEPSIDGQLDVQSDRQPDDPPQIVVTPH